MASGKTTRRALPFPVKGDSDKVASDIASLAETLDNDAETGAVEETAELPGPPYLRGRIFEVKNQANIFWDTGEGFLPINALTVTKKKLDYTAKPNQLVVMEENAHTVTLPLASPSGQVIAIFSRVAETKVTSASQTIGPGGLEATSWKLRKNQSAWLEADGTHWLMRTPEFKERSDSVFIETEQSTNSATFVTLATPDEVEVLVPEHGIVLVRYRATWKQSVDKAAKVAVFIDENQLQAVSEGEAKLITVETSVNGSSAGARVNKFSLLRTTGSSLHSLPSNEAEVAHEWEGDGTKGVIGSSFEGGFFEIVGLPAGLHKISIRYKTSSGTVAAKNRSLKAEVR